MPDEERRPPGRPRKWATEAERKRAYRGRKAAELSEPLRVREELRGARLEAAAAQTDAEAARRAAERTGRRVAALERQVATLQDRLHREEVATRKARRQRDEAQRLLGRKIRLAHDAVYLRGDPDTLVAIIAEQRELLDWFRSEVRSPRSRPEREYERSGNLDPPDD